MLDRKRKELFQLVLLMLFLRCLALMNHKIIQEITWDGQVVFSCWQLSVVWRILLLRTTQITDSDQDDDHDEDVDEDDLRWAGLGVGSCWRLIDTMKNSWGSPWEASERLESVASWAEAWCPAACSEVSERLATETQVECDHHEQVQSCGGEPGTCHHGGRGWGWCGDHCLEEEDNCLDAHELQLAEDSDLWLVDCGLRARSESHGRPFLLVIPRRRHE